MLWFEKIFTGESVRDRSEKIIDLVNKRKHVPGLYLITLASNETDQLDIVHYGLNSRLMREYMKLPMIVGLAGSKKEAIQVVQDIIRQVHLDTGQYDMRRFFMGKSREEKMTADDSGDDTNHVSNNASGTEEVM